jgi:Protein of unknown function (DUF3592)
VVWQVVLAPWAFACLFGPIAAAGMVVRGHARDAIVFVSVWVILAAGVAVITWLFYARPLLHHSLANRGEEVQAVITRTTHHRFARGPKHSVRYRFRSRRGGEYTGVESIPPSAFDQVRVGDEVAVWYLPRMPIVNVPVRFCEYTRLGGGGSNQEDA